MEQKEKEENNGLLSYTFHPMFSLFLVFRDLTLLMNL